MCDIHLGLGDKAVGCGIKTNQETGQKVWVLSIYKCAPHGMELGSDAQKEDFTNVELIANFVIHDIKIVDMFIRNFQKMKELLIDEDYEL